MSVVRCHVYGLTIWPSYLFAEGTDKGGFFTTDLATFLVRICIGEQVAIGRGDIGNGMNSILFGCVKSAIKVKVSPVALGSLEDIRADDKRCQRGHLI